MIPFIERGLGMPAHDFLCALLHHYGAQLHHLTPNDVFHLSCFVMLCEAFLGIYPHWGLFKKIFSMKLQISEAGGRLQVCGGLGIQAKPTARYFDIQLPPPSLPA